MTSIFDDSLIGQKLGLLTIKDKGYIHTGSTGRRSRFVEVVCDCGTPPYFTSMSNILHRKSGSCGCLKKRKAQVHELAYHPIYTAYYCMIRRCYDTNYEKGQNYIRRGIKVCDRWLGPIGFINFAEDMLPTWKKGLTLDRRDNDGDYTPSNCKWASRAEQAANTSKTVRIEINGEHMSQRTFCKRFQISPETVIKYRKQGLSPVEILQTRRRPQLQHTTV